MKRRSLLIGAAAGAALAATCGFAQQPGRHYRVGVIVPFSAMGGHAFLLALRERLASHGFVEGRNLTLEIRDAGWERSVAEEKARELIAGQPDALFTLSTIIAQGAVAATRSVPVVFAWVGDPVRSKIVKALRAPDGNATGVSNHFFELTSKRFELTRELVPGAKRVAVVAGNFDETLQLAMKIAGPTAERLGLEVVQHSALGNWPGAIQEVSRLGADVALVTTPFSQFGAETFARQTVQEALKQRLPVVYSDVDSVSLGGLASYATNPTEDIRRGADYLARVLKGESPATLPVDQLAKFELALNLKTARAIGFTIPQSILLRADRVIE